MADSSASQNPIHIGEDLKQIRGIGRVKRQWLKDLLNVHTIQDLAALELAQIKLPLKIGGQSISLAEIEGWVAQATELLTVQAASDLLDSSVEGADLEDRTSESSALTTSSESSLATGASSDWRAIASFRVEFQAQSANSSVAAERIVVRHQATGIAETFSAHSAEPLLQWMAAQVQREMTPEPTVSVAPAIHITQVRAMQPVDEGSLPIVVNEDNHSFTRPLRSGEPVAIEVSFRVMGISAEVLQKRPIRYVMQAYARDRASGTVIPLGCTEPLALMPYQSSYKVALPTTINRAGVYGLQVLTTLQDMLAIPGCFELPLMQVI